jgi:UDP-GlcNAc:undecaprenyl-phosphate GlcNAc-1-phosphate transferase
MTSAPTGAAAHLALVAGLSGALAIVLARLARRARLGDEPRGAEAARKRQRRAVPCVGGLAILGALVLAPGVPWRPEGWAPLGRLWPATPVVVVSLVAALAVGLWDDHRPLGPASKAITTLLALAPMGLAMGLRSGTPSGWTLAVGWTLGAWSAAHVLNTWDNADGALVGLALLGFLPVLPGVSAACAGFLPLNLDAQRPANRAARAPTAYLGDGGSFALGFLVAASPQAWGIVWLPALDLLRLAVVRWSGGSRPWIGDRRHLAHRLEARGLGRPQVALVLVALSAPATLGVPAALSLGSGAAVALALAVTALGFWGALRWTRAVA